ncbi:uncharacterized protein LOC130046441 [Ostrea edulis]|uniref:uncharacterized protein LOC130046441 n=1 Tax=Ostrea edulis TaxID=37623 RepID=UPI0024AF53CE|nr:uncharacterized protein LOC130046441 [Ostrea edulis]
MAPLNVKCYFAVFLLIGTFSRVKAGDEACITEGGTCQENDQVCDGKYKTGLCGGGINRQCCLPASDGCSSKVKEIACKIKATSKINLLTKNPSGVEDGADPYSNIRDACDGKPSKRSRYSCTEGTSPGGVVCLKASILHFIYDLGTSTEYNYQVNAIAGACHTSTSKHYLGQAVDLQLDKEPTGGRNKKQEKSFTDACKAAGGWTHGGTHVHCQIVQPYLQPLANTALHLKNTMFNVLRLVTVAVVLRLF